MLSFHAARIPFIGLVDRKCQFTRIYFLFVPFLPASRGPFDLPRPPGTCARMVVPAEATSLRNVEDPHASSPEIPARPTNV